MPSHVCIIVTFRFLFPLKFYHSVKGDLYIELGFFLHNVHLSGFIPHIIQITQRKPYTLSPTHITHTQDKKVLEFYSGSVQNPYFDRTKYFIMLTSTVENVNIFISVTCDVVLSFLAFAERQ